MTDDRIAELTQDLANVRDTLRLRSEALNATGADNDRLRATIADIEVLAREWDNLDPELVSHMVHSDYVSDLRAVLADQEPARD